MAAEGLRLLWIAPETYESTLRISSGPWRLQLVRRTGIHRALDPCEVFGFPKKGVTVACKGFSARLVHDYSTIGVAIDH